MPQISFIMPVYNTRTEWLKRAVNSVRKQTVEDWELLLIDDGSKAETARVCDELEGSGFFISEIRDLLLPEIVAWITQKRIGWHLLTLMIGLFVIMQNSF